MDDTSHETVRAVRDERFRYVRNYRPQRPYLQPIAYRDRAATMGEIYRVLESDNIPPSMWQWASATKPVEELYDTKADPDEVHNLADDLKHRATIERLRTALEEWIERIGDPLATDELEVLRARVWPPNGEQSTTAKPMLRRDPNSTLLSLSCDTPGASLGYRTPGMKTWTVYTKPFKFAEDELEVVAHRLGWKPARSTFSIESRKQ